jgi:uncharacterized C2H2 Zn-finger protein
MGARDPLCHMVVQTTQNGETWFKCEKCGLLFDSREDGRAHEHECDGEDPTYIQ